MSQIFAKFKTQTTKLISAFGNIARINQIGALRISNPYRLIGSVFGSAIDTKFWTATTSGAGSDSGVASGIATIASGTANSGFGKLASTRISVFNYLHPNSFVSDIRVTVLVVARNTRRWGLYTVSTTTPTDGAFFQLNQLGELSINTVSGGSITSVASGSFNGTSSTYTLDTNVHTYEIEVLTAQCRFMIDGVLIHTVSTTTAVMYQTLNLPITMTSVNTATGITSGVIECWNSTIFRLGHEKTVPIWKYQAGANAGEQLKLGAGTLRNVVLNKLTGTTVTLYDATSAANPICIIDPAIGNSNTYDLNFDTGLFMVTVGAAIDVTIIYE